MQQQRNDFLDWDKIPSSNALPSGDFQMSLVKIEDGESKGGQDGIVKRMFPAQFVVEEPVELAGMGYFENYLVGSAEAPFDIVPGSMGARSFKQLCTACQIPQGNSVQQLLVQLNNMKPKCMVKVLHYLESKNPEYMGQERNKTIKYMKLGEVAPGLAPTAPSAPTAPMATAPGAAVNPTQPLASPVQQPLPTAVSPQPVVGAPGVVAPPAALTPGVPATPTAVVPTGVAPPVAPAVPGAAMPPGATPEATHRCAVCQADVPMSGLQAHIDVHRAAGQV